VNYGTIEDFQYLQSQGISVQGKICIARYGNNFRGLKAMLGISFTLPFAHSHLTTNNKQHKNAGQWDC